MRPEHCRRQGDAGAGIGLLDVGIGDAVGVAIGEAEKSPAALAGDAVQLLLRAFVAGPVAAVVGEPQLLGLRMPVEADRVAHAARHDLDAGAVEVLAPDLPVLAGVDLADVAGHADRDVELVVGADGRELPVVVRRRRQLDGLADVGRLRGVELVLDAVEAQHLVDR